MQGGIVNFEPRGSDGHFLSYREVRCSPRQTPVRISNLLLLLLSPSRCHTVPLLSFPPMLHRSGVAVPTDAACSACASTAPAVCREGRIPPPHGRHSMSVAPLPPPSSFPFVAVSPMKLMSLPMPWIGCRGRSATLAHATSTSG